MIPPAHSLVKYDNPVLVSRSDQANIPAKTKGGERPGSPTLGGTGTLTSKNSTGGTVSGQASKNIGRKTQLPPVEDKGRAKTPNQTEDILNSILPPR
jgi:dynein light intermediate chain